VTAGDFENVSAYDALETIGEDATSLYEEKEETLTPEVMRDLERMVLLNITDNMWREHLYEMDYLQGGDPSPRVRPARPADGVPARGLRDVL
jgi:preprotein translocase subunit SecA